MSRGAVVSSADVLLIVALLSFAVAAETKPRAR